MCVAVPVCWWTVPVDRYEDTSLDQPTYEDTYTEAFAMQRCVKKLKAGMCGAAVAAGLYCPDHTCTHIGCMKPKPKKDRFCKTHQVRRRRRLADGMHARARDGVGTGRASACTCYLPQLRCLTKPTLVELLRLLCA